jgi:hypothetical protein
MARGTWLAVVLLAACTARQARPLPAPTVFDPGADFSPDRNPNGVWQYGSTQAQALEPSAFRRDEQHAVQPPVLFWQPTAADHFPYVAGHRAAVTEVYATRRGPGWAVRAGQLALEASNDGRYAVVRFTAPASGRYRISARFEGVHFERSTTDVRVMHGGRTLFSADIDGYGGDPAFHPVEGSNPAADYAGTVDLERGDTIDFAVGYGQNRTHFCDTTGLTARIEPSPDRR